jgi:hypothetical protein
MTQSIDSQVGTSDRAPDHDEIARVVQLYIDGVAKADVAKLREAFHEDARMFGEAGGTRYDEPIGEMFKDPAADTGNYTARIVSVRQTGDVATVELAEDGYWGTASFVDYFSLARIGGTWKIVNKVFAHTGGELPQE